MATIQATAQAMLKQAGWRMESKLARGKQCWSKTGYPKKVYIGTHGSIRVGRNLASSLSITVGALKNVVFESGKGQQYIVGKFIHDKVFGSWNFVTGVRGKFVHEMILVPGHGANWGEAGEVFNHCEPMAPSESIHDQLPSEVLHQMYDHLGVFETDELLTEARLLMF